MSWTTSPKRCESYGADCHCSGNLLVVVLVMFVVTTVAMIVVIVTLAYV